MDPPVGPGKQYILHRHGTGDGRHDQRHHDHARPRIAPSFGVPETLTACVTPAVPAGETVEFYDGATDLGPGTLGVVGGQDIATLVTPPLTYGDHTFTAVYSGDGTFDQSNSPADPVSVVPATSPAPRR